MRILLFIAIALMACNSNENPYEAFERVKEAKQSGKDIYVYTEDSTSTIITIKKPLTEWQQYKTKTLLKINTNEFNIKSLKQRKVKANFKDKFQKEVEKLEKKNADLKTQMDEYHKEQERKWKEFKLNIEHQSDEIATEIKFLKHSDGSQNSYLEQLFK